MEFDYTNRSDFTSEIFKIQVKGINSLTSTNQLKKFLESLGVTCKKIKITKQVSFVTFTDENERNKALEKLKDQKYRGKPLDVRIAKPKADPCIVALKEFATQDKPLTLEEFNESIRLSIAPLIHLSYNEQIKYKSEKIEGILSKYLKGLDFSIKKKYQDFKTNEFRPSPVLENYRNKCEFSFGYGYNNSTLTIGFKSGKYKEGEIRVALSSDLKPIPKDFIAIVKSLEIFFRSEEMSYLKVFEHITHRGHLKQIMIRGNLNGEKYARLTIDPQDLGDDIIEFTVEKLREWVKKNADLGICRYDVLLKRFADESSTREICIHGPEFVLTEKCCEKLFKISPNSFFQVNITAAELLYKEIGSDISSIISYKPKVLFDICSGTGTIGQCLESYVDKVIGIEIVKEAVVDSEKNAEANGISKCSYMCGRAEELIDLAVDLSKKNYTIIAILDPPRSGLNSSVIKSIRRCEEIKILFYVSCDMKAAVANFTTLMQNESRRITGPAFSLKSVKPFDFFPHTDHSEVLLTFDR